MGKRNQQEEPVKKSAKTGEKRSKAAKSRTELKTAYRIAIHVVEIVRKAPERTVLYHFEKPFQNQKL